MTLTKEARTGRYVKTLGGHTAFVPARLPYEPPLIVDDELLYLLSRADQALGRLDAAADILPNPDLFVQMYVRKEALLSTRVEGVTQASLADVLKYEVQARGIPDDIKEVHNYIRALNHGLRRLEKLSLSKRLLREIHAELMRDVRGEEELPGEFRKTQNWIGPPGSTIDTAAFVPPSPEEMLDALDDLERYLHDPTQAPVLIKAGLAHCQFETIHPFLDGNGRMGRLLVVFYLCHQKALGRPLLYLSAFVDAHREEYYACLHAVRDSGDVEGWMRFFLTAVWKVGEAAAKTARSILLMRQAHLGLMHEKMRGSALGPQLLDDLFRRPYTTVNMAATALKVSYPTANSLIPTLVDMGLLREVTGRGRNRVFVYYAYVELMERGLDVSPEPGRGLPVPGS